MHLRKQTFDGRGGGSGYQGENCRAFERKIGNQYDFRGCALAKRRVKGTR